MASRGRHNAYYVLLAAAGTALAIDRLLLGGGSPVSAHAAPTASDAALGSLPSEATTNAPSVPKARLEELHAGVLAGKLASLDVDDPVGSLFQPVAVPQPAPPVQVPPDQPDTARAAPIQLPTLSVSSIMIAGPLRRAIVNRTVLVEGDTIEQATLVQIKPDFLLFDLNGTTFEVFLRQE